mmetsp:Transcript_15850/g.43232  ORF Transcript_15850/g.43232 Transcript_15850/m.43232 type:complete len:379 (-) Transcript_15850:211-1347(-)
MKQAKHHEGDAGRGGREQDHRRRGSRRNRGIHTHLEHQGTLHDAAAHAEEPGKESGQSTHNWIHHGVPRIPLHLSCDEGVTAHHLVPEFPDQNAAENQSEGQDPRQNREVQDPEPLAAASDAQGRRKAPTTSQKCKGDGTREAQGETADLARDVVLRRRVLADHGSRLAVRLQLQVGGITKSILGIEALHAPLGAATSFEVTVHGRKRVQNFPLRVELPRLLLPHLQPFLQGSPAHVSEDYDQQHCQNDVRQHLGQKRTKHRTVDGEGLHDNDEIPIYERLVELWMPLPRVQHGVCNGASQDGDVRQSDRVLGSKSQNYDEGRHQDAATANPTAGCERQSQTRTNYRHVVGLVERKQGFVIVPDVGKRTIGTDALCQS